MIDKVGNIGSEGVLKTVKELSKNIVNETREILANKPKQIYLNEEGKGQNIDIKA